MLEYVRCRQCGVYIGPREPSCHTCLHVRSPEEIARDVAEATAAESGAKLRSGLSAALYGALALGLAGALVSALVPLARGWRGHVSEWRGLQQGSEKPTLARPEPPPPLKTVVAGIVYDSVTRKPVSGAAVRFSGDTWVMETTSDGKGRYLVELPGPPTKEVDASADGYSVGELELPKSWTAGRDVKLDLPVTPWITPAPASR